MPPSLSSDARLEEVRLRVRDAERVADFYASILGLARTDAPDGATVLGPEVGESPFRLVLEEAPDAPPRPSPSVGLYHFALLYPDRGSLATAIRRVQERGWSAVDGAADHGVSEAFYLRDPEGNGVELYRDRPREAWPRAGEEVAMVSEPLDLDGLLAEAGSGPSGRDPALGHLHLHVSDLDASGRFYTDVLGLRVRQSSYPGALFLAAGDYHHHLGLNVWARGRLAPEGATGLVGYRWLAPEREVDGVGRRARARDVPVTEEEGVLVLTDPDGNRVALRPGGATG